MHVCVQMFVMGVCNFGCGRQRMIESFFLYCSLQLIVWAWSSLLRLYCFSRKFLGSPFLYHCWGYRCMPPCQTFYSDAGIQVFVLGSKPFTPWKISPTPSVNISPIFVFVLFCFLSFMNKETRCNHGAWIFRFNFIICEIFINMLIFLQEWFNIVESMLSQLCKAYQTRMMMMLYL